MLRPHVLGAFGASNGVLHWHNSRPSIATAKGLREISRSSKYAGTSRNTHNRPRSAPAVLMKFSALNKLQGKEVMC